MATRRVLITGVEGFTGRYVRKEFQDAGWEVFGTGTRARGDASNYSVVDLTDARALHGAVAAISPDAVVHLAGVAFVGHGDAEAFYRVNLVGTRNLLAALAALDRRPRAVLLASSANVYGNASEGMLTETTPPNPANDYAVSKLAMEYMARLWLEKLPIVIARPFNYTGVGQSESFLLPKIVAHYKRRAPGIELGNLDVWRDFSDVRAVASAYRLLVEVPPVGETVNVCSGRMYSLREILSMLETMTGHRMQVSVNPQFVRANDVKKLCGSPAKLRQYVGDWEMPALVETLGWMLSADDSNGRYEPA